MMLAQEEKTELVDVAIPLPIEDPYTYRLPQSLVGSVQVGCRVRVPFRNRTIIGYVVALDVQRSVEHPKEIMEVIDSEPLLTDHLLRLTKWVSETYFSSWGEAISNVIPRVLKAALEPQPKQKTTTEEPNLVHLNEEQEQALTRIRSCIEENRYKEFFIFGVTGGGKSELYIRAIKEVLKRGKSVICLVPEIALTEQLKLFFVQHFHDQLEILHSKLSLKERSEAWHRIRSGEKKVILGARSAVFAPVSNLGLIIMDEEQEGGYKQDQTPRYHAREVARWRASDLGALFIMGTATPTLETMYRTSTHETEKLVLSKRVDGKPMPQVKIIDLKETAEINRRSVIISPSLKKAIEETLNAKRAVLLMLNRRGFSTHVRCFQCGEVLFCQHCAVALTFHQEEQEVLCHYCNFHMTIPTLCTQCKHPLFRYSGVGTEKVESEVARIFPKARVARLDTDTTRKRGSHERILTQFRMQEIDILVGTQMIAKGFDFQHVNLVGIVNADTGLLLPDFRSAERTFQLLTQMAGRTGRGSEPGTVFIQTYSPNHYSIQYASEHDYAGFFNDEIERRRTLRYPPFTRLINLIFRGKKDQKVREQASQFRKALEDGLRGGDIELLGPAPLPLYRLRGHYRWHLMIRGLNTEPMRTALQAALGSYKRKTGVYLAIDVDPLTIL
ncbi:MAG: primosomal protein N' [Candidatus Omnitrophica bacterium]|nr:primosomal protein N' [Candidatus Omnitrophota bacterium]